MKFLLPFLLLTAGIDALPSRHFPRFEEFSKKRIRRSSASDKPPPPSNAQAKGSGKCGQKDWQLTEANWKAANVDKHFRAWYSKWTASNSRESLIEAFGNQFLGQSGGLQCDTDYWCVIPACTNVLENAEGDPVKWAYFAAHGMANLNNWMKIQADAWQVAQGSANSNSLFMVQQFTDATDQFPPQKHGMDMMFQLLSFGMSGLGMIMGPGAGSIASAIGSVIRVTGSLASNMGRGPEPPSSGERQLNKAASVGVWVDQAISSLTSTLSDLNVAILRGDNLNGRTIVDLLANGAFMYWDAGQGDRLRKYYKTLLSAKVINALYTRDRHYIARVPAPGGDCTKDNRWPKPELRYCDPKNPSVSYWYKGYSEPTRKFSNPKGQDILPSLGFTFEDIMRSSVGAFKMMGNNNTYVFQGNQELYTQILEAKAPEVDEESEMFKLPIGAFHIPICARDYDNVIMGAYDDVGNAGYPCTCGADLAWADGVQIFKGDFPHTDKPETRMFWHLTGWDQAGVQGPNTGGGYHDLFYRCRDRGEFFIHMYDDINRLDLMPAWPGAPPQKEGIPAHWPYIWRTECRLPGPNGGYEDC